MTSERLSLSTAACNPNSPDRDYLSATPVRPLLACAPKNPLHLGRGFDKGDVWVWPHNRRRAPGMPDQYRVRELDEALSFEFDDDAHAVAFVVIERDTGRLLRWQPRINMGGLSGLRKAGFDVRITCLMLDLDNEGHTPWRDMEDDASRARVHAVLGAESLASAAVYLTRRGLRPAQPVARWLTPEEYPEAHAAFAASVARDTGVIPDPACKDWTRHFRLPSVVRDGRREQRIGRWTWTPVAISTPRTVTTSRREHLAARQAVALALGGQGRVLDRARAYLNKVPVPQCGTGLCDKVTFSAACTLARFGVSPEDSCTLLHAWSSRGTHRWKDGAIFHKVTRAMVAITTGGAR